MFVLPNGEALCAAFAGDNTGPPPLADVQGFYAALRASYPSANVTASTFDAFFATANQPEIKAQLPVVTKEIEDAWIHGVPADPLKNAQVREASRQRLACLDSGKCSKDSPAMQAFERLLTKVPEHTAGVAHMWFLPDNDNYTNPQFDRARAQQPLGFVADNRKHADYNSTVNSWIEQRAFVTQAPLLLRHEYPELAASISAALVALKAVEPALLCRPNPGQVARRLIRVWWCGVAVWLGWRARVSETWDAAVGRANQCGGAVPLRDVRGRGLHGVLARHRVADRR